MPRIMAVIRMALLNFFFVGNFIFLLSAEAGKDVRKNKKQLPAAGWCLTRHRPLKIAQSGYGGYCKVCYQEKFPKKHVRKK